MKEQDDLFRDFCENALDLIQSVSPDGQFLYVNRSWLDTLGYTRAEVEDLDLFDVIHPESLDHCRALMKELMAGQSAVHIEADFRAKDGRRVPVVGSASVRYEGGRPTSTRGIFHDVSERRRAEEDLNRFFNLSLDLLCIAGIDGYFKKINPAFEKTLGYSREEMLRRSFVEFVHPEDRGKTETAIERLAQGLPVVDFHNRYLARDGSWRWLAWRSVPMQDRGLIYAVARDITEEKQNLELIARQARELERSNTDLEQFAYAASHDLRSPLRAIAQLSEWIEKDLPADSPGKARDFLRQMRERVGRMETLTDDLLQYSRAVRAKDEIVRVDTGALIRDLTFLIAPPDGFTVTAEPGMPVLLAAKSPLEQVFRNLIANAVHHHDRPAGRVTVSAAERGRFYEFAVADDGPGVPEKERERIFEMFRKTRPRSGTEGTGLGLALVRRMVDRAGGRVWVESGRERGAVFRFTWPKRPADTEGQHADHPGGG